MKMAHYQRLIILCIQVIAIMPAPLQLQYQSQFSLQPTPEELMQQQLFALQQLQNLQNLQNLQGLQNLQDLQNLQGLHNSQNLQAANEWNNYYPPIVTQNQARPMMIILPETQLNALAPTNNEQNNINNILTKTTEGKDKVTENEDSDSVVIEAEPHLEPKPEPEPKKIILLVPNTRRFSIGGIISAIPFLPIEINVPDTISWIYDGISSIIAGIGNRFPWRPTQTPATVENNNLKLLVRRLQNRNQNMPTSILMLPDVAQVYPMPIPMQF